MQMQTQKKTHATDGTQDKKYVQKRKKKHTITGENACRYYKTIVMIPSTLYMNTPFATNTTRTKKNVVRLSLVNKKHARHMQENRKIKNCGIRTSFSPLFPFYQFVFTGEKMKAVVTKKDEKKASSKLPSLLFARPVKNENTVEWSRKEKKKRFHNNNFLLSFIHMAP